MARSPAAASPNRTVPSPSWSSRRSRSENSARLPAESGAVAAARPSSSAKHAEPGRMPKCVAWQLRLQDPGSAKAKAKASV